MKDGINSGAHLPDHKDDVFEQLKQERDEARYNARVLADAVTKEIDPLIVGDDVQAAVHAASAYPARPDEWAKRIAGTIVDGIETARRTIGR